MTPPEPPQRVGVVGAGTMGAGIAQVCLAGGHDVLLYDVEPGAVERGRARIEDGLRRSVARGRMAESERAAALARLGAAASLADLAAASDLVIEAALEDLALKRTIFRELDAAARPDVPLASNTSALSIDAIAEATTRPERVLGLHFFNPAPLMALVEVVAGTRTSAVAMRVGSDFVAAMGKTPVACGDAPGFIVNRVNRPFTLEALRMIEAGEGTVGLVDAAVQAGGYPMGPFALMDLVGIDVNLAVADALWRAFDEATRFRPSPIQRALVRAGRLGRKSGRGFYRYDAAGGMTGIAPLPTGLTAAAVSAIPSEEIVPRLELAVINEAYHAAGEGVADPRDIDLAMRLGAGHPYGPFERARALGLGTVVRGLRRFEERYGERYRVAHALWQIAAI
ncbi:MAG TPA: 3-hydroxyacyl-CoA dehydrogenase NAD-binding domain-containing protein [Candidatus Dormibacteraeota bacterium]|nr:3-hydroxyacyl-CoA dehydrogenase NAD-binding domain-containing protein [Candidatus Dormibacteraeota bacterium]